MFKFALFITAIALFLQYGDKCCSNSITDFTTQLQTRQNYFRQLAVSNYLNGANDILTDYLTIQYASMNYMDIRNSLLFDLWLENGARNQVLMYTVNTGGDIEPVVDGLHRNADRLARFYSTYYCNLDHEVLRQLFREYVDLGIEEIQLIWQGSSIQEVYAFESGLNNVNTLAAYLGKGACCKGASGCH